MSTILSADDLNDFIAPGAACIKPVQVHKTSETAEIAIGPDGVPVEQLENEAQRLQAASISLTDCLACSGCITSSEAVLVEMQSPKELFRVLKEQQKVFVVSISPQTRASLATAFGLSIPQVDDKLMHLFVERLGFKYAVGTETGRVLALEESRIESLQRGNPVLCSVCPGWTLYAEKTHPHVLPYMSHVKSPQQVTGSLIKRFVAQDQNVPLKDIFHLSVMPCFDKKLESARPGNVIDDDSDLKEVDLVITAKEIVQMLTEYMETDFKDLPATHSYTTPAPFSSSWDSNAGSSSGGYLWYIVESLRLQYPGAVVETSVGKNADVVDYKLVRDGQVLWTGAEIYGFRNIQNLVRKLKPGKRVVTKRGIDPLNYNYVEVMACPSGCTNGGGQIGAEAGVAPRSWHSMVESAYNTLDQLNVLEHKSMPQDPQFLYTSFAPVEKDPSIPEALAVGSQW